MLDNLKDFEKFLNVMGIECSLKLVKTIEGHYELFFDYNSPMPFFDTASSGTLSLVAFFHYEISEKLVEYLKEKYKDCQVILTTHNTNLMTNQLMRPDCVFILSRDGRITALCDATDRELREGHNLEKLYIGGEFEKYE